jgi:hypothetical protein
MEMFGTSAVTAGVDHLKARQFLLREADSDREGDTYLRFAARARLKSSCYVEAIVRIACFRQSSDECEMQGIEQEATEETEKERLQNRSVLLPKIPRSVTSVSSCSKYFLQVDHALVGVKTIQLAPTNLREEWQKRATPRVSP